MNYLEDHPSTWHVLLEALADGTALLDQSGIIHDLNETLLEMTGYQRDELLGRDLAVLVPPRLEDTYALARGSYFDQPSKPIIWRDRDLSVLRKDGTEFPAEISLSSIETEEGTIATVAVRDISERAESEREKALHEQLAQAQRLE